MFIWVRIIEGLSSWVCVSDGWMWVRVVCGHPADVLAVGLVWVETWQGLVYPGVRWKGAEEEEWDGNHDE